MSKLILVTGGARSGKSSYAEEKVKSFGEKVVYIATSIPFDEEMKLRVKKHREQRPRCWETVEAYKDFGSRLEGRLAAKSAVLLDCVTIMVSNLMFEQELDWDHLSAEEMVKTEGFIQQEIEKLIALIKGEKVPFVLVTNELGMGIVPENKLARIFRDIAGRANQMLAKAADEVFLCVSGIPVRIK